MSISPLSATSAASLTAITTTQQSRTPRYVQTAAKALGMDVSDVMSALKSGKSLADLATQQGVSTTDLASALKADAPQDVQGSSGIDAMMQALISQQGVGGPGHHGHGGPPPSSASSATGALTGTLTADQQSTLSALSGLLGTDSSSLLSQLQSGASLASLLDDKGVSTDTLAASLQKGLLIDAKT
jgi:lambda repressor-like predicted transcriptional regulator